LDAGYEEAREENGEQVHGPRWAELLKVADATDVLINMNGDLTLDAGTNGRI
jgi:hypothetical protein